MPVHSDNTATVLFLDDHLTKAIYKNKRVWRKSQGKYSFVNAQGIVKNTLRGPSPIFSQPLSEANVHRISLLIDFLKKHVAAEGIFRISGSKKRQDELKHLLDKDIEINFGTFTEHDVASILKYFLAELPEPIITSAHIKVHMQIGDLGDEDKQMKALQLLFLLIPPANRHLLQQLLELLHEIANIKENKMSACSLALVFAPSIIQYKHKSSSCLSVVPEDITTFIAALAFMIENVKGIFLIPDDLLQEISEHQKSNNLAQDEAVVSKPFCAQIDARLYSTTGNKHTADGLVDLYTQMAAMEDTPMKRQFLKRFAEFYPGTPPFKPKTKKAPEEEHKTTFNAPKIISPRFRRLPLQSVNKSETESLCDSPTGNFRPFHTPGKECSSQTKTGDLSRSNAVQTPATPSGYFHRRSPSMSSIRNPFKRKRRTQTIGSSSESSCDFSKPHTPKPRRTSSSSELEKPVSKPVRAATAKKPKKSKATVTPVIKKSLVGRDIRNLYSTPMNSSRRNKPFPASAAK